MHAYTQCIYIYVCVCSCIKHRSYRYSIWRERERKIERVHLDVSVSRDSIVHWPPFSHGLPHLISYPEISTPIIDVNPRFVLDLPPGYVKTAID